MAARARVFVSSASGALAQYRKAAVEVCHRLGLVPVNMEEFNPQRPPPVQVCRCEVQSCDVFVLLLAYRYGARPAGQEHSYTELEYEWAASQTDRPLVAFVVDPNHPWPPRDIDRGADAEALSRFVARVRSAHTVKRFDTVEGFREELIFALRQFDTASGESVPGDSGESSGSVPARLPSPPAFHAVPPYTGNAPFTGRLDDLATLDEWGRSADPVMVVEAIGGTGKSALTWEWTRTRAPTVVEGLAGRLWWSFYDGSASMTRFLRELLAYVSARPLEQVERLDRSELSAQVLTALRSRPYLLILDGFERLLAAYHRFDPSKLRDDEVELAKRSLIEPHADEVLGKLTAAGPSKILISTRLLPDALDGRFGQRLPGVGHLRLPGLTDPDTVTLLARLDIRGSDRAITGFFRRLDNHPLLVGIIAGLVRDHRPDPGGFDRWLADPTAGGALSLPDLPLTQRRTHILDAALAGLPPRHRRLLGWISVLAGSVGWATLKAINPFRPEPPARDTEAMLTAWRSSEPVARAEAQLVSALKDLEDRGLLWWDRSSNSYDLHPIVRAYVHDQLEDTDRVQANDRVRDHFEALPPEDPDNATSVEDLRQTITIFRALVGANHLDDAGAFWARVLGNALVVELGVYATVLELLTPLAIHGRLYARADLSIAYCFLDRYEEAIDQEIAILADVLRDEDVAGTEKSLSRLGVNLIKSGAEVAYVRCLDLLAALTTTVDDEVPADLCLKRAIQAARHGQVRQALALLNEAEGLETPINSPWFEGDIRLWQLNLALVADESLTEDQLAAADAELHSWWHRRRLAELRCDFLVRHGQFERALTAAWECERLERNAGLETVPARSTFLLAKLGRRDEASTAVQESLDRLPRIHPAARPHYRLAQALWELERRAEAVNHAREAYRQAWRDGPPYCHHWDLRDARELLNRIGEPPPDLPTIDPATVKIPLEDEVRAFIAKLEAEPRDDVS